MNLSPNFTYDELTNSEIAARRGIDNRPPASIMANLKVLAAGLEQVRAVLQVPMIISSAYRSPAVNRAVGGSAMSAHCEGFAADFIAPAFGKPQVIAKAIKDAGLAFDQLIYEGTWVHISFAPRMRKQVLTAHFGGGPATYTEGIA